MSRPFGAIRARGLYTATQHWADFAPQRLGGRGDGVARRSLELILARSLSENLAVPCFVVNDAGAIVWFNESAERLIGRMAPDTPELSPAELIEMLDVRAPDEQPADAEKLPFIVALTEAAPVTGSYCVSGSDGTEWIDAAALPLLGPDGGVLGVLFACYPGKRRS